LKIDVHDGPIGTSKVFDVLCVVICVKVRQAVQPTGDAVRVFLRSCVAVFVNVGVGKGVHVHAVGNEGREHKAREALRQDPEELFVHS